MVFAKFLRIGSDIPHYPIYLLLGILLWTFFTDLTTQGLGSVVARGDLIRKIRIPRTVIVVSIGVSALINLALNSVVILVFSLINKTSFNMSALWLIPLIIELYVLGMGVAFFLSAMYVKYRDLSYIWELVVQAGFYITPILYPLSLIESTSAKKLLMINPLAQIFQDARYSYVSADKTDTISKIYGNGAIRLIPVFITILVLLFGYIYFRKNSKYFAENM